jgi:hypothetical protein
VNLDLCLLQTLKDACPEFSIPNFHGKDTAFLSTSFTQSLAGARVSTGGGHFGVETMVIELDKSTLPLDWPASWVAMALFPTVVQLRV